MRQILPPNFIAPLWALVLNLFSHWICISNCSSPAQLTFVRTVEPVFLFQNTKLFLFLFVHQFILLPVKNNAPLSPNTVIETVVIWTLLNCIEQKNICKFLQANSNLFLQIYLLTDINFNITSEVYDYLKISFFSYDWYPLPLISYSFWRRSKREFRNLYLQFIRLHFSSGGLFVIECSQ